MPLSPADRLGPYEIIAPLGAGGMGEVYRARDSRLGRDVAIKILTDATAGNAERQARFEREARAVAALNHPNIVSIHDIGTEGGVFYIVSELIEGESLRGRIQRGHISVRELLQIAVQIADGIAAAHAAGIVHRDLKPENIMLTSAARVKILDFGLARQVLAAAAPEHTVTLAHTLPGTILGTVNYMSPEQARGDEAGPQSDQFSLGLVLYELATGSRAFERDTTPQTLTAILVEEPAPLDPKLPAPLRWTIDRCLAKDPKARYAATDDLYQDLRNQLEHFSDLFQSSAEAVPAVPPKVRRNWLRIVTPIACLAAGMAGALLLAPKPYGIENYRYTPIEITLENPDDAAWSPDGAAVAYSSLVDGKPQAFLRYLASPTPAQLTHDPQGVAVEGWVPDGKRIYITGRNPQGDDPPRALFSLSVTGGDPEFVMPLPIALDSLSPYGVVDISRDGKLLAALTRERDGTVSISISSPIGAPLQRYPSGPFESKRVINRPHIRISPDGTRLLYLAMMNGRKAWLLPLPAGSGTPKEILTDLPKPGATPTFSWFPDNRRIAIALHSAQSDTAHLWIADTVTGRLTPLTTGVFDGGIRWCHPAAGRSCPGKRRTLIRWFRLRSRTRPSASGCRPRGLWACLPGLESRSGLFTSPTATARPKSGCMRATVRIGLWSPGPRFRPAPSSCSWIPCSPPPRTASRTSLAASGSRLWRADRRFA